MTILRLHMPRVRNSAIIGIFKTSLPDGETRFRNKRRRVSYITQEAPGGNRTHDPAGGIRLRPILGLRRDRVGGECPIMGKGGGMREHFAV